MSFHNEPSFPQLFQDDSEVMEMDGTVERVYDDIISVSHCELMMRVQDDFHQPLVGCWCPMEAERENPVLAMALGDVEGCLQPYFWC